MGQRGVAVEDLEQEQVDDGDGVEQAGSPGVPGDAAGVEDGGAIELGGEVLLDLSGSSG